MKSVLFCLFVLSSLGYADDGPFAATARFLNMQHASQTGGSAAVSLPELEQMALQANPELRSAARRVAVAEAHISSAGALDDPSAMYRGWQVPLRQPWDYNSALNMFMVGQAISGAGKRGLRSDVAADQVTIAEAELEARKREVLAQVRKAYFDLLRTNDQLRVHHEQVAIAQQGVEAARIRYSVGHVPQQDVLKAQIALTKLAEHLIMLEQDGQLARVMLNSLLGRDPASPLEVTGQYATPADLPSLAQLEQLALSSRPEVTALAGQIKQAEDELKLAQRGYSPDFAVNLGYMLMPSGSPRRNTYMLEGSMSLPWLNRRKHDSEISEAQAKISAQQADLQTMQVMVMRQIQEALIRAGAAKRLADLYAGTLRPQAETTLRSTVIAYENDHTDFLNLLDSQNTTLEVEYSYFHALADFEARMAELELAVGTAIPRPAGATAEVTR
jgi:cobalt-zinc-cadmium efflux system outer membrane protein